MMHGAGRRKHFAEILRSHFSSIILLLLLFLFTGSIFQSNNAQAAIIPWDPNSSGHATDFDWQNGGSDKGLLGFGDPVLEHGNTLHFNPQNFIAKTILGKSAIKSDRLQVDIIAHSDIVILGVEITESGVYDINTEGKVSASGAVFLTNLSQYEVRSAMFLMNPAMPISTPPIDDANWSSHVVEELDWTHLRIVLNNNLIATSRSGSNSFIQKTDFDIRIITNNDIPEPATVAVLTIGGLILPLFGKKKKYD